MEKLKLYWDYRYVPDSQLKPDDKNRWMVEGKIDIDCRGLSAYDHLSSCKATVAYITMKGTANADFVDHPSLPKYNVKVNNVLEESSLFNTGYGNTSQFYGSVAKCKAFAEKIMNFHFDMLRRAECRKGFNDEVPYPLTVVRDRYSGTYSGGDWLAFNEDPKDIPEEPFCDDVTCAHFWRQDDLMIGVGESREFAIFDLIQKLEDT